MPKRFKPTTPAVAVTAPTPLAALPPALPPFVLPSSQLDRAAARAAIARLAAQAASREGLEVAWVDAPLEGKNWVVRVFIDRTNSGSAAEGVSLSECARVSDHLSVLLDLEDPVGHPYTLEVSSPGMDRPLFTAADFRRFAGKLAVVITTERVLNQTFFRGHILAAADDRVSLKLEGDKQAELPYTIIKKANLEVEF